MSTTVADIIARMRAIDEALPEDDGVAVFNRMYLTVTEQVAREIEGLSFENPDFMTELDVVFAGLFLEAYDAPDDAKPTAWAPLFQHRHQAGMCHVQFALSGMNTHIEHDLPIAVVRTCEGMGLSPRDDAVQRDYEAITRILAEVEAGVRRSFLDDVATRIDDRIGPVVHLISAWSIDKARDVAWVTTQTLWTLRDSTVLRSMFESSLVHSVGMTSRLLLTSV